MISNFDDILQIARVQYYPNHLSEFIQERYGLKLSHEELQNFARLGLWPKNKLVSVENENIDHLMPVLQTLEERILTNAQIEHPGLLAYLNSVGLNTNSKSAIVDIGYSATIQGYLNRFDESGYTWILSDDDNASTKNIFTIRCNHSGILCS